MVRVPLHLARKLASKYNLDDELSCLLHFNEEEKPIVKHLKSSPQKGNFGRIHKKYKKPLTLVT
jgi:hypothetical protein